MCEKCEQLQIEIDRYKRALAQRFDALTTERLKTGLATIEAKKVALHPDQD